MSQKLTVDTPPPMSMRSIKIQIVPGDQLHLVGKDGVAVDFYPKAEFIVLDMPIREVHVDLKDVFEDDIFREMAYTKLYEISALEALYNRTKR